MPNSWKPEVEVNGKFSTNALRFATKEEASANARDLMQRWMLVTDYRAAPSDDPVNYRWSESNGLIAVDSAGAPKDG